MRVCLIFDISSIPKEHARAGPSVSIRSSSERSLAKDSTDTPALVVSLVGNSLYTLLPSTSVCDEVSLRSRATRIHVLPSSDSTFSLPHIPWSSVSCGSKFAQKMHSPILAVSFPYAMRRVDSTMPYKSW